MQMQVGQEVVLMDISPVLGAVPIHNIIEDMKTELCFALIGNGVFGDSRTFRYQGCFLNGYDGEKTGLEWHADDDPGIDHSRPIAVVTLYDRHVVPLPTKGKPSARVLQTMPIGGDNQSVESFPLLQGSLLLMKPGMQSTHYHRIPKPGAITRPRISLTFRALKEKIDG